MRPHTSEEKVNILVVDVRPENIAEMKTILQRADYNVVSAHSGNAALVALLRFDFAVILLDVKKPDMDGLETAALIRREERCQGVPIVFLGEAALIYHGYSAGAVDFLTRPIDPDILRAKVGVFGDLYQRRRALKYREEALRRAERELSRRMLEAREAEYEATFEAAPVGIARMGSDGRLARANQRFCDILGRSRDDILGLSLAHLVLPELPASGTNAEGWLSRPDGSGVCVDLTQSPVLRPGGALEGTIVVLEDITQRRRAEEALRLLVDENAILAQNAQQAVRVRDDFLSIASHELRTPLTPLQIQLQRISRSCAASEVIPLPRLSALIQSSERQVQRLTTLVDNLLDVTRIATDRLTLCLEQLDLEELVSEVATRFSDQLARAGCTLEFERSGPVVGRWDPMRIDQVVSNLLSNAAKYAAGSPVEVLVSAVGSNATIAVNDRGIGIPPDRLNQIFGRFERAVPARSFGGLGLGLYIAREIVKAHGGSIEATSRAGAGATFTVTLPLWSVSRSAESGRALTPEEYGAAEQGELR